MRISNIDETFLDYPDNSSLAVIVFCSGCDFDCKGCQNKELRNPDQGEDLTYQEIISIIEEQAKRSRTNKIILSGGDPLACNNIRTTENILNNMKGYNFCVYTGYDIDYVKRNDIKNFKFIKCGNYIEDKKITSYKDDVGIQFASTNQKLYDENYNLLSENGYYKF